MFNFVFKEKIKKYIWNEKTYLSVILMWLYKLPKMGFVDAYKFVRDTKLFDIKFQIDTDNVVQTDESGYLVRGYDKLTLSSAQKVQSSNVHRYNLAIDFLKKYHKGNLKNITFIDMGSGKGKVLILAKHDKFFNVIGVELSYSMIDITLHNLYNLDIKDVIVHECSAADYNFPGGELVIYLFNPFGKPIMDKVVSKILEHNYLVHVIYSNPVHATLFDNQEKIKAIYPENGSRDKSNKKLKIYQFIPCEMN